MSSGYTQFILNDGEDDEEILETTHNAVVIVPEGMTVYIGYKRYLSQGSTVYVDNQRIAVGVGLKKV